MAFMRCIESTSFFFMLCLCVVVVVFAGVVLAATAPIGPMYRTIKTLTWKSTAKHIQSPTRYFQTCHMRDTKLIANVAGE